MGSNMNLHMDFAMAAPEIFLLAATCVILVVDLMVPDTRRAVTQWLSVIALLATAGIAAVVTPATPEIGFHGTFILDPLAGTLDIAVCVAAAVTLIYARSYMDQRDLHQGEFYLLALFSVLGAMVIISGHNFLTLYLGLELMSLALYAMVAFNRESVSAAESAMKYFVLGAISSGMMLYGMSILYGVSGSLDISQVSSYIVVHGRDPALLLALTFVVASMAFKFGAVPFHMWMPDVYNGAPTPVTLFIGSAPKIGAFAMFMRLLVAGLSGLHTDWSHLLIVLSVLSLGLGSFLAIAQTNIKRMLAYSTITHVGFILLGILAGTRGGYAAATFYTLVYVLMTMAAFGILILLSRRGFEAENLDDLKGLNVRSPWFAGMMLLAMFSMTGVPPTVGFYAKLVVLSAVVDAGHVWLAALAVVFAMISAFYYLRVVKLMYFDQPEDTAPIHAPVDLRAVLSANGIALLVLGVLPGALMGLCQAIFV